jgi:hypothetical protein
MNEAMNESIRQVVYRLKTLSYDLNTLQNRFISILFDIMYDTCINAEPVRKNIILYLEENREFMKRLVEDIDVIIRKLKTVIEANKE